MAPALTPTPTPNRSLVAPAADAIDPGLLAAIEKDLELDLVEEEMDLRQSEVRAAYYGTTY